MLYYNHNKERNGYIMLVTENNNNAINPNITIDELPDYFVYKRYGKVLSIWQKCNIEKDCVELNYNAGEITLLFIVIDTTDNSVTLKELYIKNEVQDKFNLEYGSLYPIQKFEIKEIDLKY